MTDSADNVENCAGPAKPGRPVKISLVLDPEDHAWLLEQGYPYALDAAGYLRMFVRQGRLGIRSGPPARQRVEAVADNENYYGPAAPGPTSPEVDAFVADVMGEAEATGLVGGAGEADSGGAGSGQVVALGPRPLGLLADRGHAEPVMSLAAAFGRRN
jgi:hypothetical protein